MKKVLKFSADWCSPCKQMTVQMNRLQPEFSLNNELVNVDVDSDSVSAKKYNIRSIPTLIKLNEAGEEIARSTGSMTDKKLVDFFL